MLKVNLFITLLSVWVIMYLNYKFLRIARINKVRYKLFALRDELSILVMKGDIDVKSVEYKTLRDTINNSISALGTFSITHFLRFAVSMLKDPIRLKKLEKIAALLNNHDNKEFQEIARTYFNVMHEAFNRNIRLLYWGIRILIVIFAPIKVVHEFGNRKAETIKYVDNYFEERTQEIGILVPA